jgi:hypothetical protein
MARPLQHVAARQAAEHYAAMHRSALYLATLLRHVSDAMLSHSATYFAFPYAGLASDLAVVLDALVNNERLYAEFRQDFCDPRSGFKLGLVTVRWGK